MEQAARTQLPLALCDSLTYRVAGKNWQKLQRILNDLRYTRVDCGFLRWECKMVRKQLVTSAKML